MPNTQTIKHLGIILDGNRRWAKNKNLPTLQGHRVGYDNVKSICELAFNRGIKILTVWAFSTENWKRSKEEVGYLMKLLKRAVTKDAEYYKKKDVGIKVIGRMSDLDKDLQKRIKNIEEITRNCAKGILRIGINYGGRVELVDALKKIVKAKIPFDKIDEKTISENIYTPNIPNPDLIIRTSGEQRLSGFLLWQSPYSELYFPKVCWPDFSEKDLDEAIEWFNNRKRRFGGD
ncbi:MAG: polyprenyl diphosphate synthase [Patescibacteria group bacterium]|nr:polyprenyl diphosphate synthase [Patescibacteria group bacterium]